MTWKWFTVIASILLSINIYVAWTIYGLLYPEKELRVELSMPKVNLPQVELPTIDWEQVVEVTEQKTVEGAFYIADIWHQLVKQSKETFLTRTQLKVEGQEQPEEDIDEIQTTLLLEQWSLKIDLERDSKDFEIEIIRNIATVRYFNDDIVYIARYENDVKPATTDNWQFILQHDRYAYYVRLGNAVVPKEEDTTITSLREQIFRVVQKNTTFFK